MHARYDAATRKLTHWSTVPFTTSPDPGGVDAEIAAASLPGPLRLVRVVPTLDALEVDPSLEPAPPADVVADRVQRAMALWLLKELNDLRAAVIPALPPITRTEMRDRIRATYSP